MPSLHPQTSVVVPKVAAVHTAPATTQARPWLARLHPALFAIPLSLFGLSGAWRRMLHLEVLAAAQVADVLLFAAFTLQCLLLALWLFKLLLHPKVVRQEWGHPVQGALLALLPVSSLMALIQGVAVWPPLLSVGLPLVAAVLLLQGTMAWHVVHSLSSGKTPPELVTPALYLPTVPGGFIGAMALDAFGLHGWATLLMGMGLGAWALLEMRVLHRLFAGPLPPALRTTMGIEIAPAAVGTLAVATIWPQLPIDVLMLCLGVASGPVLAVLTRWRYLFVVPFNAGFWSFAFPLSALVGATVEAVCRGHWPASVAMVAVGLASAVALFLTVRTFLLLLKGQLLPAI